MKQEIKVPDGYKIVGEPTIKHFDNVDRLVVDIEKIKPRYRIFMETGVVRKAFNGEWYAYGDGGELTFRYQDEPTIDKFRIWREVKDQYLSFNSEEQKLSLSVAQCKKLLEATAHINDTADILEKFIKENS